jgi:hypothetical protein
MCEGKAIASYQVANGSNNRITFKIVSAKGCDQN